jgi:hypothetical protein
LIRWVSEIRPTRISAAKYVAEAAPSASDADRQRWCDEFERDALSAIDRLIAHRILGVSLWEGVDHVAVLARDLFEAISPPLLAEPNEPNISDLELISKALDVCKSLTWWFADGPFKMADVIWSFSTTSLLKLSELCQSEMRDSTNRSCARGRDRWHRPVMARGNATSRVWPRLSTIFWWKVLDTTLTKLRRKLQSTLTTTIFFRGNVAGSKMASVWSRDLS